MQLDPKAIRDARHKAGYSLERLAVEAGIALSTLFGIESGTNANPRIDTVSKIAKTLRADGRTFFTNSYRKNAKPVKGKPALAAE